MAVRKICLMLCFVVALCHTSKLRPRVSLSIENRKISGSTSPTISVQRFNGNQFYPYVKHENVGVTAASTSEEAVESTAAASSRTRENEEVVFATDDEDDADEDATTLAPTTPSLPSSSITESSGSTVDRPSGGSLPDDSPDEESAETTPEIPQTPSPADPVPGQPGDDESDSSSSSEESSSSSSSEEFKQAYKKAWENKIKHELRANKVKDTLSRTYSSASNYPMKVAKKVKLSRSVLRY